MSNQKLFRLNFVHVKNFLSYIDTKLILNDKGLTLISGIVKKNKKSNGAGKSALIADSITWALFGETIRDIKVNKIPNRFTKGQCSVEVNFDLEGHNYSVIRTKRPDSLQLIIDGNTDDDKAEGDSRETTKRIMELIKMDFDEFVNSILFGQNIQKYFFLLKDSRQKDMLDNMISIAEIVEKYKAAAKELRDKSADLFKSKKQRVDELQVNMEAAKARGREIERKEATFLTSKNQSYDAAIETLNVYIQEAEAKIAIEEAKRGVVDIEAMNALKTKQLKITDGVGKLTAISSSTRQTIYKEKHLPIDDSGVLILKNASEQRPEADLVVLKGRLSQDIANANAAVTANNGIIASYNKKIASVAALHNADCPTCGRTVDDSCVDSIKKSYMDSIAEYQAQSDKLSELTKQGQATLWKIEDAIQDRRNQAIYAEVQEAKSTLIKYEEMIGVLKGQLSDVTDQLSVFNAIVTANYAIDSAIHSLKTTKETNERNLSTLLSNKEKVTADNPYVGMKEKEQAFIDGCNVEIAQTEKEMDGLLRLEEAAKYWLKAFGDKDGIKSYIYAKIFPYLNERCNHYLKLLSNGEMTASIGLDDKDRFVVDTDNAYGADAYGGNCLVGNSLVSMANGTVKFIKDIEKGNAVWSVYPNTGITKDTVTALIPAGIKDVYKLKMEGREITASGNHPFLAVTSALNWKNERYNWLEWKQLKELNQGDIIAILPSIPDRKNPIGINFSDFINEGKSKHDFLRLLGFYMGDGWVRCRPAEGYEIALAVFDTQLETLYKTILTDLFGLKTFGNTKGVITVSSKKLVTMIQTLSLTGKSYEKTIPDWVMTLPNNLKQSFIEGYLDADGNLSKEGYWKFEATSESLIYRLRMMLIHMGYRVSIGYHRDRSNTQTIIAGKVVKTKHHSWGFTAYPNCSKGASSTIYGDTSAFPNYLDFKKISSIEHSGQEETFDIKIQNSHNFFADGILVHNSGGERRRIDMAVMFALHDLVASRKYKSNILILDEIFDSMDTNGIDSAMSLLHDISSEYDSIFVISHTDLQEHFDNNLFVVKDDKSSYVVDSLEMV